MAERESTVDETRRTAGGFDRRRALKLGVAAGVGVKVWMSPSITSIGVAPAMAAQGSEPIVNLTNQKGLQATANGACVNWGQAASQNKTFTVKGNAKVTVNLIGSGVCIDCSGGQAQTSIITQPTGYTCTITGISVSCGSGGSGPDAGTLVTYNPGQNQVPIPCCPTLTNANSFVFYNFKCVPN